MKLHRISGVLYTISVQPLLHQGALWTGIAPVTGFNPQPLSKRFPHCPDPQHMALHSGFAPERVFRPHGFPIRSLTTRMCSRAQPARIERATGFTDKSLANSPGHQTSRLHVVANQGVSPCRALSSWLLRPVPSIAGSFAIWPFQAVGVAGFAPASFPLYQILSLAPSAAWVYS